MDTTKDDVLKALTDSMERSRRVTVAAKANANKEANNVIPTVAPPTATPSPSPSPQIQPKR